MVYVTTASTIDEIDERLRKNRGKIIFKHNDSDLQIDLGKYKSNYSARVFSFINNELILNNTKKFIILLEKLKENNYSEINNLLSELNTKGARINITNPIRINPKIKKCQVRVGSLPIFIVDDDNSKLKELCNFESQICKNDSKNFKPQYLLKGIEPIELSDQFKNISEKDLNFLNSKYILCGKYEDDSILNTVSSEILNTIKQDKDNFDNNELLGLTRFCYTLMAIKRSVSQSDVHLVLESSYQQLLSSSLRSNEIHKNFGELYAAIKYSLYHPNREILLPVSDRASFFDFISVENKNDDNYVIIKKVPIKIKPKGAATSFTALLDCLYFNKQHSLYKDIELMVRNSPKNNRIIHQLKNNTISDINKFQKAVNSFYNSIDYKVLNDQNLWELIKPIFKNLEVSRKFWQYILPAIDIEKTKNKIEIGMVDTSGMVDFTRFNPMTVSISMPKRPRENVTAIITNKKEKILN